MKKAEFFNSAFSYKKYEVRFCTDKKIAALETYRKNHWSLRFHCKNLNKYGPGLAYIANTNKNKVTNKNRNCNISQTALCSIKAFDIPIEIGIQNCAKARQM